MATLKQMQMRKSIPYQKKNVCITLENEYGYWEVMRIKKSYKKQPQFYVILNKKRQTTLLQSKCGCMHWIHWISKELQKNPNKYHIVDGVICFIYNERDDYF